MTVGNGAGEAPEAGDEPETILCDTSFVSIVKKKGVSAEWPEATRERLDKALLAINIVTLAELRAGHLQANWGERKRAEAESLIASYLLVPLDMPTVDECARLRAECKLNGINVPDNDIWIAATANVRSWPLVSCDGHFDLIPDVDHIGLKIPS